jgi:hypothetical protein
MAYARGEKTMIHFARSTIRVFLGGFLAAGALAGCGGNSGEAPFQVPASVQPAAPRIVAFGDVHGDLEATRIALRLAGAIDEEDRWIGGDLVVVQTGDQLDRGDEERAILHLFARLMREARAQGGAFHPLNGNHELMNSHLDFRYITIGGFEDFADLDPFVGDGMEGAEGDAMASGTAGDAEGDPELDEAQAFWARYDAAERGRVAAFLPGGPYALMLAERNTIVQVGENVFVHGGVLPDHARAGLETINTSIQAWLRGERDAPEWSRGGDSPIWTRLYSSRPDDEACVVLDEALEILGAKRMIVGHTVHRAGVTPHCEGRLIAVDVGMAAYYRGPREVLEIRGDTLTVISAEGERRLYPPALP